MLKKPKFYIFSIFCLLFSTINTYGYFDPGIGSLIIQVIASIIAAVFTFYFYLKNKIKKALKFIKNKLKTN